MTWALVYMSRDKGGPDATAVRLAVWREDAIRAAVARADRERGHHPGELEAFERELFNYGLAKFPNRDDKYEDKWAAVVPVGDPVPELTEPTPVMQPHEYEYPD